MSRVETKLTLYPSRLVLVTGAGGTGKSSLIEGFHTLTDQKIYPGLTDFIEADVVDKDAAANKFTPVRDQSYVAGARAQAYEQVFQETATGIAGGRTVLVNASFRLEIGRPGWHERYEELAKRHGAFLRIIRLVTSPETLYRRIIARNAITDRHKLTNEETWKAWLQEDPIEVEMPPSSLILRNDDDDGNFPVLVEQTLVYLKSKPIPGMG